MIVTTWKMLGAVMLDACNSKKEAGIIEPVGEAAYTERNGIIHLSIEVDLVPVHPKTGENNEPTGRASKQSKRRKKT